MTDSAGDVAAGRAAWERIRGHDRKSWEDWVQVARALAVGRAETMKAANTNRPVGTTYNRLMGKGPIGDISNEKRPSAEAALLQYGCVSLS
jgi:hypothetical protein